MIKFRLVILRTISSVLLLLAAGVHSQGQTHKLTKKDLPPSAFKLISVNVTGTKRYTREEVLGISGLQLGQTISEDDFKHAAQVLGETGAFSDVVYSFQFTQAGTKLELQVQDAEQFVPARFDNFVWFSDRELMDELRARVPLFKGELPIAGNLPDLMSDALQAMLIEHHVAGRADYLRSAVQDGPITAIVFSVTGVEVRVHDVGFTGAGAEELPPLEGAAQALRGQKYSRSALRPQADKDLLPIYLARGFLKAKVADAQAKVVTSTPEETQVEAIFPVDPGQQYKVSQMQWEGNKIIPVEKLQAVIHLQAGQIANAVELKQDLRGIRELYGSKGYMAASIQPIAEMDDARGTVAYQFQVKEGDLYHMGEVEILGLDTRTMYRLRDEWKLRGGDAYDSSYTQGFLSSLPKGALPTGEWNLSIHETLNEQDKTVDVTLRFDPKAGPELSRER